MALSDEMRKQIAKDAGVKDPFAKGDKAAAKIITTMAELGLGGAAVKAGQFVYRGLKGARAMAAARKAISAAKSAAKAKPKGAGVSKAKSAAREATKKPTVKPKPPQQVAVSKQTPKPRSEAGKPTTKAAEKPKVRVKTEDKKTPPRAPGLAKNRKRVDNKTTTKTKPKTTKQMRDRVLANQARRQKSQGKLTNAQKAAVAVPAVIVGAAAVTKAVKDGKPASASPSTPKRKPSKEERSRKDYRPGVVKKTRPTRPRADQSTRTKPVVGTGETGPDKSMPKAGKRASKRTSFTAGKNTGFGPKGNIFPKNAADRKRLMAKYGGTGSRAAKAAAAGTQGNLKK